ncbi:MAG: hypothetical protein HXL71_00685 [Dialister invisus]|nr:hypothetical protein [Dialister invisus]
MRKQANGTVTRSEESMTLMTRYDFRSVHHKMTLSVSLIMGTDPSLRSE